MRRFAIFSLVTAALIATATTALAAQSPKALLAAMRSAVRAEHSVRYVSVDSEPSYKARTISDVGLGKGVQQVTVTEFGKTGPAEVRIIDKVAYIKGTVLTLDIFFGFSPAQAKKYADQWISIPHSNPAFAALASGATFESFRADLFPVAPLYPISSGHLIGVKGIAPNTRASKLTSILAPKHGKPLPVTETTSPVAGRGTDVWTMSHWDETFHVVAPAHAVPIKVINGG